jgi:tetratricopeptide (TPR) repeat protein
MNLRHTLSVFAFAGACAAGPALAQPVTTTTAAGAEAMAAAQEAAVRARMIAGQVDLTSARILAADAAVALRAGALTITGEAMTLRAGVLPMAEEARALAAEAAGLYGAQVAGATWFSGTDREGRLYSEGRTALDKGQWERAIERYTEVAEMKASRADAALYWKAFAQDRQGQRAEALTTLATLQRDYPQSRYLQQAKVLEAEVRQNAGQPVRPQDQADEDLKLMALNALQHSAPEQAVPMLEKLLHGTASPRLKERALFVLAQSNSPQARQVLAGVAKGNSTPDLQGRAITYLGQHGGRESRALLAEVYASTSDVSVKRGILRAYMVGGEKDRLVALAQSEQNPELRAEAVRQLGSMNARAELWQLYQREGSADIKKQILRAMFVGGDVTRMTELARTEQNPDLRREAIRNLGLMGAKGTSGVLVELYGAERDAEVKRGIVQALYTQGNAEALVGLARKEQDAALRTEIVRRLSTMTKHKAATDYMLEILGGK